MVVVSVSVTKIVTRWFDLATLFRQTDMIHLTGVVVVVSAGEPNNFADIYGENCVLMTSSDWANTNVDVSNWRDYTCRFKFQAGTNASLCKRGKNIIHIRMAS